MTKTKIVQHTEVQNLDGNFRFNRFFMLAPLQITNMYVI